MNLYGIKFREKGDGVYKFCIVPAATDRGVWDALKVWAAKENFDVDMRTVSWAGPSVPLHHPGEVIYLDILNLDEL